MQINNHLKSWLTDYKLTPKKVYWNLSPEELYQHTIDNKQGKVIDSGAIAINTGKFTGRSPKDRFIVETPNNIDKIWWGKHNQAFSSQKFDVLKEKMMHYLSQQQEIYIQDAKIGALPAYEHKLRVVCMYPWSALFAYNMFRRLEQEVPDFSPEWTVINAPTFLANPETDGTYKGNFSILNLEEKLILVGGSGYTGEIKKGMFSAMNFIYPTEKQAFPMHASANVGEKGDTAIFFGLSGTGKTTLSADPNRRLLGDDEHAWTPDGKVFNYEGGCYAKVIGISEEKEPDIFNAIKRGALVENVVLKSDTTPDYDDDSITENTRVSYPIHHINNIFKENASENVKNIFFLTADAWGVIPPIAKLTPEQSAYYFVSGFTSKLAGTEDGIVEPKPSFSTCFGAPFMPLHPFKYAKMLRDKINQFNTQVWLINTGWIGGGYGVGERIKLKFTRAMINAALNGDLENVEYKNHEQLKIAVPQSCPNVPSDVLNPKQQWKDKDAYTQKTNELTKIFKDNFNSFEDDENKKWILKGAL